MRPAKVNPYAALLFILGAVSAVSGIYVVAPRTQPAANKFPPEAPLDGAELIAAAAILYDPVDGRILFQKNADEQLPLASLTKLMSAHAALSARGEETRVRVTSENTRPFGDSGLRPGDVLRIGDLVRMGLVSSSNDAMAAAAASLGGEYITTMNNMVQTLGLKRTRLLNPTGLDESADQPGAWGTAYDVARLTAAFYAAYPAYFELTAQESIAISDGGRMLISSSTSQPLHDIAGFIGAKTGYTTLAGGNVAAVFDIDIGHPLVAVVLHSTQDGRFTDIRTLIEAARAAADTHTNL